MSLLRIKPWKVRGVMMSPFERRGKNGFLERGSEVVVNHKARRDVSIIRVESEEGLAVFPAYCTKLYAGDVSERGKGFKDGIYEEITKPRRVKGKSIATSADGYPVVIYRKNAEDQKT